MKWLIINTESFSPRGVKQKKDISFEDLPWAVQKFLSVFKNPFIILDESSKIKSNTPMKESAKSTRSRVIKLLNKVGHRCIMTGTLMSKSPLNVIDQYEFLKDGYFPESMWEFAEKYCVMSTIRVGRGRRVLISQKDYEAIRTRLKKAYLRDGKHGVMAMKEVNFRQYGIDYKKQDHIIQHKKYTPFLNVDELLKRIADDTIFVKREEIFDIKFDRFVKEPIVRTFEVSSEAKRIANELVDLGFTDNLTLGKAPALELLMRLQDVCNGFEPIRNVNSMELSDISPMDGKPKKGTEVELKPLKENPKLDALMELLEEIDAENNQVVVWGSRKSILRAAESRFRDAGYSYVLYDGDTPELDKKEAQRKFHEKEVQIFLANQASGAYGLNCLSGCSYAVYLCVDGSVEKYHQSQHRLLRGELAAPKFAYAIYGKGTVEEKQWTTLKVGQELIGAENTKDVFRFL